MNQVKNKKSILLFLIPALALYGCVQIGPLFQSLYYSFFSWKGFGEMKPVGLQNYIKLFTDDDIMRIAFKNTFLFAGISLLILLPFAFMLAVTLTTKIRFSKTISTILYMPGVISTVVVSLMWCAILNAESGPVNAVLRTMGLDFLARVWLGDPKVSMYVVIFVNVWQWAGYHMLIFYTSLQSIPGELYEAASIDGSDGFKTLRYITIPLMYNSIKMNATLIIIGSFKCFDIVYNMTMGGPADSTQMLATYMYHNTFRRFNYGYGSAISMVIFLLSITVSAILQKVKFGDESVSY